MSPPLVRVATERDIAGMLELWRELESVQAPFRIFPMVDDAEAMITRLLREAIDDPDARAFVIDGESRPIGMAVARMDEQGPRSMSSARIVELSRVVVSASERGRGLGRALIAAAAAFGRERGAAYMTAKLFSGNSAGRAFWEGLGFVSRYEERVLRIEASEAADILGLEEAD
jgi:GNAT superfamily N-acetyltransferase